MPADVRGSHPSREIDGEMTGHVPHVKYLKYVWIVHIKILAGL